MLTVDYQWPRARRDSQQPLTRQNAMSEHRYGAFKTDAATQFLIECTQLCTNPFPKLLAMDEERRRG